MSRSTTKVANHIQFLVNIWGKYESGPSKDNELNGMSLCKVQVPIESLYPV